ncbi:MAG: response regulator [Caldithrix sp.]|nr:response regulator [Caldithrix sp.]
MKYSVLVVDDDQQTALVLTTLLQKEHFEIHTVSTRQECLNFLQNTQPHLILMDVMLPDIMGTDLTVNIKNNQEYKDISIILISGVRVTPSERAFGLEIGADDYISRPFEKNELLARIKSLFRLKDSGAKNRTEEPFRSFDNENTQLTASDYQQQNLTKSFPQAQKKFVKRYKSMMEKAIEDRLYKTDYLVSGYLKQLAADLEF